MAKDTANEDDDDKFEKMDDESLNFLEQVRKGKSRNFVLSMKGNKVRSMLIKKKPIKEKDRKAAKGDGFQPVYGVATGSGPNITFAVARSDGFDEKTADRKTEKLKKFLKEQTGKLFKPDFELVDTPPAVEFDDEDLNDPLIARFMKMEPVIVKACDAHPNRVDEIQQTVNEIRALLQDDETRDSAGPKIDSFVQFLKDLLSGAATNPPSTPDPSTPQQPTETPVADPAEQSKKLAEALKKLKPLVDSAINSDEGLKPELHGTMAQIAGEIKSQDFQAATQNIKEFAQRLKSLATERPVTTATDSMDPVDRMQEYSARRDALEPRFLEAQQADREKATKLGAVWDYADQQAQAGNFDNAFKALDRLEAAIGGTSASSAQQTDVDPNAQFWQDRIAPFATDYKLLVNSAADVNLVLDAGSIERLHDQAQAAANAADYEKAHSLQNEVDELMEAGRRELRTAQAEAVIPDGIVQEMRDALEQARKRWDEAIVVASSEVSKVQTRVRDEDPALASALDDLVASYKADLSGLLAAGKSVTDGSDATRQIADVLGVVESLRNEVANDPAISYLDEYDGDSVSLQAAFDDALADITTYLRA